MIAAAAALAGREAPTDADLWPLILAVPTAEQQTLARETLRDLLEPTENQTLNSAAEAASLGPLARAARIAAAGYAALQNRPDTEDAAAQEVWKLKLEGIAREMDAAFLRETLPAELAEVRAQIAAVIGTEGQAPPQ